MIGIMNIVRIVFYILVLIGLIYVLITASSSPCDRCRVKDAITGEVYTCEEYADITNQPFKKYDVNKAIEEIKFNMS